MSMHKDLMPSGICFGLVFMANLLLNTSLGSPFANTAIAAGCFAAFVLAALAKRGYSMFAGRVRARLLVLVAGICSMVFGGALAAFLGLS